MSPSSPPGSPGSGIPVEVIVAFIGLLGVLAAAAIGYLQWRRAQANQRALEAERAAGERERTAYEDRLARERLLWEESHRERREAPEVLTRLLRRTGTEWLGFGGRISYALEQSPRPPSSPRCWRPSPTRRTHRRCAGRWPRSWTRIPSRPRRSPP